MKRILVLLLSMVLLLPLTAQGETTMVTRTKSYYTEIIKNEVAAIKKCALSNGAIGMYEPSWSFTDVKYLPVADGVEPTVYGVWKYIKVNPYFSDSAVYGLMMADRTLSTTEGKSTAKAYIEWYVSVMNTKESDICGVAGTVYDYYVFESKDGQCVNVSVKDATDAKYTSQKNPNDYDSTDSYASLMFDLIKLYIQTYGNDFGFDVKSVTDTLLGVINSVYIKSLDLTIAKPNYPICYLMDNCEVYYGLQSAEAIYRDILGDATKADECADMAQKIKNAILTKLWNESAGCYVAGVSDTGKSVYNLDTTVFYPQGTAQVFPIIFGLYDKTDTKAISTYDKFIKTFGEKWLAGSTDSFPWCMLVRACIAMEDYETATKFIDNINVKYSKWAHTSPYYCAEAGNTLAAAAFIYTIASDDTEGSETESEESAKAVSEQSKDGISSQNSESDSQKDGGLPIVPIVLGAVAVIAISTAVIIIKKKKK